MARIRSIKPEFWRDEKLGPLKPLDRLVFLGLISFADDAGRLLDSVKQIDAALFPYTDDSAREALDTLAETGRIQRGTTESGLKVIQIRNWGRHQRINRPNLNGTLPAIVATNTPQDAVPSAPAGSRGNAEASAAGAAEAEPPRISEESPNPHNSFSEDSVKLHGYGGEGSVKLHGNGSEGSVRLHCPEQLAAISYQLSATSYQRAASSEPYAETSPAESVELVSGTSARHAELLAAAANRGVAERHGEQHRHTPITLKNGERLTKALAAASVPLAFALDRVQAKARMLTAPPRALAYFTDFVLEQWAEECALYDAERFAPAAWEGHSARGASAGRSAADKAAAERRTLITFARDGDAEAIAECERLGIDYARAIA